MKIQYLGTAAAEGAPALFCHCANCERMRKAGGKNIRARTQALVNDDLLIDFNADTYMNFTRFGLDASGVKNVIVTHSHHDHFLPVDMILRRPWLAENMTTPKITLYGNRKALEDPRYKRELTDENIAVCELKLFEKVQIGDYEVTPLRALHAEGEDAFIFLVEKEGKTLLYCNDTGLVPKDSVAYMKERGVKLDFIGFDCTFGHTPDVEWQGHMGLDKNVKQFEIFKENGLIKEGTKVVVTHFSHWHLPLHEEMEALANPYGFKVAYDGACYEF